MAMEDLPHRLAWDIAEAAAGIRDSKVPVDKMGWFRGDTLEYVANDVIREGLGTPAAYELTPPPRFRPLPVAIPLFERLLEELGCPSVEGLAAWWPEDQFNAKYPQPARTIGRTERLWLAVSRASSAFAASYEPLETDFYTAGELGRVLAQLFTDGGHEAEIGAASAVLTQPLAADDDDVGELISTAIEWFHDKVVEREPARWAEAEALLPLSLRGWFE
jgi:hypothetical protein